VAGGFRSSILGGSCNSINNVSPNFQDGSFSVVVGGQGNNVSGSDAAIVGGYYNTVSGFRSFIGGGSGNVASGWYSSVVGGEGNQAAGGRASVVGGNANSASGNYSFVGSGLGNTAQSYAESVLGLYATVGTGNATSYIATDRLLVVGNGATSENRSNALTILKNANTTIGGSLTLNGNGTSTSITFPTTRGTIGQLLKTSGDGTTSWSAVSKSDVGLGNVENTAISTWAGSSNITTLGTIATGTWNGTTIALTKGGTGATTKSAAFDALSPMSTLGDIIYGGIGGTGTRLGKGTADQVLAMNAGATAPEWVSLTKTDVGLGNAENTAISTWAGSSNITTLGTVATGTWSGTTISLAKGGTGATTKTAAFDALSPMTTQGDIVYGGTSGTGTRLAKGMAGQVLTMNAGATDPVWSTPASGTVTSVSGTGPISVATGTSTPVISISEATTSAAGSMSAADKNKLNVQTTGTATGQMQYWNGTAWVTVAAGVNGQLLKYKNGVPTWVDDQLENLTIGDSYQGGVIAYFFQAGDPGYVAGEKHGLIAAVADASNAAWYDWEHIVTISTGTALGTGSTNTAAIVAAYTGSYNYAAKICANYEHDGYTDWFLPSKDELNKLYLNLEAIGGFATGSNSYYYSSSQSGSMYAWAINFNNGASLVRMVQNADRVRPVRVF
jgi:hypothetical protein